MAKYPSIAATGQRQSLVAPKCSIAPALKGSVLLCLRCTLKCDGDVWESMATSDGARDSLVKVSRDEQVNSPARMKPKNPRQKAAQSMVLSNCGGSLDHT